MGTLKNCLDEKALLCIQNICLMYKKINNNCNSMLKIFVNLDLSDLTMSYLFESHMCSGLNRY